MDNSDRRTIEECVRSHASVMPEKTAVVCDGRTLSYARLWEEALRKRDELIGEGRLRAVCISSVCRRTRTS